MQVSKPSKFHILGTDTDVGKTWVSSKLVEFLNHNAIKCLPVKPVHSGWPLQEPWGEDFLGHKKFIEGFNWQDLCAYRFIEPMSPHAASKLENKTIDLDVLTKFWNSLDNLETDLILCEGIGGVCCPLSPKTTYLDFLKLNPAPCILVSKIGLGSLNHALMSDKLLRDNGLEVCALVLNPEREFETNDLIYQHAKWELETQTDTPIFGPLSRNGDIGLLNPVFEEFGFE